MQHATDSPNVYMTTISGPVSMYRTGMLVLAANNEVAKGRVVTFVSFDLSEKELRRQGLDARVRVRPIYHATDCVARVESCAGTQTCIWLNVLAKLPSGGPTSRVVRFFSDIATAFRTLWAPG